MKLSLEIRNEPIKILIVSKSHSQFVDELKKKFREVEKNIYIVSAPISNYDEYGVVFFIDEPNVILTEFAEDNDKKVVFILFNNYEISETLTSFAYDQKLTNIKIINLSTSSSYLKNDIDTIMWFVFSRTEDVFLHIYHEEKLKIKKTKSFNIKDGFLFSLFKTRKSTIITLVTITIFFQLAFLLPLGITTFLHYKLGRSLVINSENINVTFLSNSDKNLILAKKLYALSAPLFNFFALGRSIDDVFSINTSTNNILHALQDLKSEEKKFTNLIGLQNKSESDISSIKSSVKNIFRNIRLLKENTSLLVEKIPTWNADLEQLKNKLEKIDISLSKLLELEPFINKISGVKEEQKYLLLFANNMEQRPGGGFIGSFAIINVKNYSAEKIQVFDVYDADGQLEIQVDPPDSIVRYLNQTHWFLRDSAYSPDFYTNASQAKFFLEEEIGENNFDGTILITTTAVENLLSAMGSIYLPDFKEKITSENFYLKAQLYAEQDFFPGSIQKKSFLSSLLDSLILQFDQTPLSKTASMLEKSLDEKQIVVQFEDKEIQSFIEKKFWAGKTLKPQCSLESALNCVLDYIFPIEANLGVNKANFFVKQELGLKVRIDSVGKINNIFTVHYTNNSYTSVFPGGVYSNYFQLYLPPNSIVQEIALDNEKIDNFEETNNEYKTLGFFMEIQPQSSKTVKIKYTLPTTIISGSGIYQLLFQKQIGSPNSDLKLEFELPTNISMIKNNFSPLVNKNKINYNTSISSDRIFLLEFNKR